MAQRKVQTTSVATAAKKARDGSIRGGNTSRSQFRTTGQAEIDARWDAVLRDNEAQIAKWREGVR